MNVTCFALEPAGTLRPMTEAAAIAGWRSGDGPFWIHLGGGTPEAAEAWLAALGVDPELIGLLKLSERETRILPLAEAIFVAYPVPAEGDPEGHSHSSLLFLDRVVITVTDDPDRLRVLLAAIPAQRIKIREGTPAGLLCALAIIQCAELRQRVVGLRREGDALTREMDADPGSVPLDKILAAKRRVHALAAIVDEELAVLEVLQASKLPVLPLERVADALQIAIEIARATDRDIDRLDARLVDLHRRHESFEQEQTNRRLGLLTVLSAIFMPLTLITGIYGMNFDGMPELHLKHGYPIVLAVMATIASGLAWRFRSWWK